MRIKYGGGAGHNPSLQNYQYEKGDDAILGNKVQTSLLQWGTRACSPTPTQADGLGPALESQTRTQEPQSQECESREALEIIFLQNVTTSPQSPSGAPLSIIPKTCELVASGTHSLPFHKLLPPPGGASHAGFCLINPQPPSKTQLM